MRLVSREVWTQLKCVFPNAMAFEVKKGVPSSCIRCELCDKEETDEEAFAKKLHDWAVVTSNSLPKITKGKRTVEELHFMLLDTDTDDESTDDKGDKSVDDLYLVHGEDMDSWRAALKVAKAHTGKDRTVVNKQMIDTFFSHRKENVDECQMVHPTESFNGRTNVFCYRGWHPRSLFCSKHCLVLQRAVFKVSLGLKESEPCIVPAQNNFAAPCLAYVSNSVEALTYSEYFAFLESVFGLGQLLFPCDTKEGEKGVIGDGNETSFQRSLNDVLRSLMRTHHPRLRSPLSALGLNSSSLDPNTPAGCAQLLSAHFVDGVCQEATCNDTFAKESIQSASREKPDQGITNVVDLLDEDIDISEQSKMTSATEETANIDSSFSLRVFEFDSSALHETVVSSILGLPKCGSSTGTADATARRSSRKRKASYPSSHILREDSLQVGAHYNIASVRLLLYQACPDFRIDQNLTMIIPFTLSENGVHPDNHIDMTGEDASCVASFKPEYTSFELPFDWNDKSLEEAVAIATEGKGLYRNGDSKTSTLSKIFLFRRNQTNDKKNAVDATSVPNETLLDALFEIVNISSPASSQAPDTGPGENKENKSRRRTERGFRGTLLHSSVPKSNESSNVDSPETGKEVETSEASNAEQSNNIDKQRADGLTDTTADAASPRGSEPRDIDTKTGKVSDSYFVILDQSDDEKLSTRSGSGKELERPSKRRVNPLDETLSVLVSHSGTVPSSRNGGRDELSVFVSERHRRLRSTTVDPMEEEVVNKLVEAVSQEQKTGTINVVRTKCREAAKWARETNSSKATIEELLDSAFAKYLDE